MNTNSIHRPPLGGGHRRRGAALVPTLVVVSSLAIFALAMMMASMSGSRSVIRQSDEHGLASAVESVAMLATEQIWSGFLAEHNGASSDIYSFRAYLDTFGEGIDDSGPGGPPDPEDGTDVLEQLDLPKSPQGVTRIGRVNLDAVNVVRRDVQDSTQLWITVSASTSRGAGLVNPILNKALQQVWTVEPEEFEGFDFGLLANNVNCIFCHTQVDSVERYFNDDPANYGSYDRVKVGTLESLMLRHNMDGNFGALNDYDADSVVAGTVYSRGKAEYHNGVEIDPGDWSSLSLQTYDFDADGNIVEDPTWGSLTVGDLVPAGTPPDPLENLYLDYPSTYDQMVDGPLPTFFPPPIPDNGGIDLVTGDPSPTGAGNKLVDPEEFAAVAEYAEGAITAGIITTVPKGFVIANTTDYSNALFVGNQVSVAEDIDANLILTGTELNPITIDGTVAVNGDVLINGYVKGEGTIVASGNIYIPTDLQYLDGQEYLPGDVDGAPTGPRTFGVAQDGTKNALGLASGGNVLIGDYTKPGAVQEFGGYVIPPKYNYVSGSPTVDPAEDDGFITAEWNFSLAEASLFNRAEWAKTQKTLPGPGENDLPDPNPLTPWNEDWTVVNPAYVDGSTNPGQPGPAYVPRYYQFGPDDPIPIYNKGDLYFDGTTESWKGDTEVPLGWNLALLDVMDPTDPSDPYLSYTSSDGAAPVVATLTPTDGWITDLMYKVSLEYFEDVRPWYTPMQIDGLIYTNNAIFSLVHRFSPMLGSMTVNGSLVAADLGMLVPAYYSPGGATNPPGSPFTTGLQLNYDERVKDMLNVTNPYQVQIKRTLWNPTANLF